MPIKYYGYMRKYQINKHDVLLHGEHRHRLEYLKGRKDLYYRGYNPCKLLDRLFTPGY